MENIDIPAYAAKLGYVPFEGDRLVIGSDMIVLYPEKHTFAIIDLLDIDLLEKTGVEVEHDVSITYGTKMDRGIFVFKGNLVKRSSSKNPGKIQWNGIYSAIKERTENLMEDLQLRDPDSGIPQKMDQNYGAIEAFIYEGRMFAKEKHIRS